MSRKYKFQNPEGIYFISFATVYWLVSPLPTRYSIFLFAGLPSGHEKQPEVPKKRCTWPLSYGKKAVCRSRSIASKTTYPGTLLNTCFENFTKKEVLGCIS